MAAPEGTLEDPYLPDQQENLDWKWDFSDWLASGVTISSYVVTVPSGITLVSDSNDTTSVTAQLDFSSGKVGTIYRVEVKATLSATPSVVQRSRWFKVVQR